MEVKVVVPDNMMALLKVILRALLERLLTRALL